MNEIEPDVFIEWVHQHTENNPPDDPKDLQELWKDFDEDSLDEELADLWQWGLIEVDRNDEDVQMIQMTEFGLELHDIGVMDEYVAAQCGEKIPMPGFNPENTAVRTL